MSTSEIKPCGYSRWHPNCQHHTIDFDELERQARDRGDTVTLELIALARKGQLLDEVAENGLKAANRAERYERALREIVNVPLRLADARHIMQAIAREALEKTKTDAPKA